MARFCSAFIHNRLRGLFMLVLLMGAAQAQIINNTGSNITLLRLNTTYSNSSISFSNVPGISFTADANSTYQIVCTGNMKQGTAAGGFQLQWTGPSSPTGVQITATIGSTFKSANAFSAVMASTLSPATSDTATMVTLSLINGPNAGTVQLQAASDVALETLTIEAPFICTVTP